MKWIPRSLSALRWLGFVAPVAALLAVVAGVRGIRAARELDGQGRHSAGAGMALGGLGLLVFIAIMASSVLGTQRDIRSLLISQLSQGTISQERAQQLATDIVERAGATMDVQSFPTNEDLNQWLIGYTSQHLPSSQIGKQQEQIILALSEILIEIEPPVDQMALVTKDANDGMYDMVIVLTLDEEGFMDTWWVREL